MKKVIAVLLSVLMLFSLAAYGGCASETTESDPPEEDLPEPVYELSPAAADFIKAVDAIISEEYPEITLDAKNILGNARLIYNSQLGEDDYEREEVIAAKNKLDGYQDIYDGLVAEVDAEQQRLLEEARVAAFLKAAEDVPSNLNLIAADINGKPVTLTKSYINEAWRLYGLLWDESKIRAEVKAAFGVVEPAKGKIDRLDADYFMRRVSIIANIAFTGTGTNYYTYRPYMVEIAALFKDLTDGAKAIAGCAETVERFLEKESEFLAAEAGSFVNLVDVVTASITLASKNALANAFAEHNRLTAGARETQGVRLAFSKLDAAQLRYEEIFAEDQIASKIPSFISSVNVLPVLQDEMNPSDYYSIFKAESLYNALSDISKEEAGVIEKHATLLSVKERFDHMGFRQLAFTGTDMTFDGLTNSLVLENGVNTLTSVGKTYDSRYVYSSNNRELLIEKVRMYLYIYIYREGITVADYVMGVRLSFSDLEVLGAGVEIPYSMLLDILKRAAEDSGNIPNGAMFAFSFNFEDLTGEYTPSALNALSSEMELMWL
jgi:hypothetical protein